MAAARGGAGGETPPLGMGRENPSWPALKKTHDLGRDNSWSGAPDPLVGSQISEVPGVMMGRGSRAGQRCQHLHLALVTKMGTH